MCIARITKLKYEVITQIGRDEAHGLPCLYCWEIMSKPTWDHVIPLSRGGPNTRRNMVVVCSYCNADKSDLSLPEYEGVLLCLNPAVGERVKAFNRWITADWTESERAEFERVVSRAWAESMRARMKSSMDQSTVTDIRSAVSRILKVQVMRERDKRTG